MTFNQNQIGLEGSFGYIWMNTGNWTGTSNFAYTTSYKELTGLSTSFTLASPSQDFAMTTDGRLKYTGLTTKLFSVSAACYASLLSGAVGMSIQIRKNGSAITGCQAYYSHSSASIDDFQISLSTNDYLSVFVQVASNQTAPVLQVNLGANSIGGS